jgi:hypothetical protein
MEASRSSSAHWRCIERSLEGGQKGATATEREELRVAGVESLGLDPVAAAETPPPTRLVLDWEQEPEGVVSHAAHARPPEACPFRVALRQRTHAHGEKKRRRPLERARRVRRPPVAARGPPTTEARALPTVPVSAALLGLTLGSSAETMRRCRQ